MKICHFIYKCPAFFFTPTVFWVNYLYSLSFFVVTFFASGCSLLEKPPEKMVTLSSQLLPELHPTLPAVPQPSAHGPSIFGKESNTPTYFGNLGPHHVPHKTLTSNTADYGPGTDIQFRDADIRSVLDAILGDALKLNYTVDPALQGKITLRTSAALTKEALLPALESALLSVSAAIVKQGAMYHVVPLDAAPQKTHGIKCFAVS